MPIQINPFAKGQAQARKASMGVRAATPERLALMKAVNKIPGVRVVPVREELRAFLKHPNGVRLRREGSVEWPNDRFTQRRIADGDIKIVEPDNEKAAPHAASHARRGHAE
jgi:hypothetical protein